MIFGENETDIKWIAEPLTNESCSAENLDLNDSGELLLKCESGKIKWSKWLFKIFFAISQEVLLKD